MQIIFNYPCCTDVYKNRLPEVVILYVTYVVKPEIRLVIALTLHVYTYTYEHSRSQLLKSALTNNPHLRKESSK